MKEKIEELIQVGLKISERVNGLDLPFHFVVISHKQGLRRLGPYDYDRITYITIQAGSPHKFVNVPDYEAYANLTVSYSEKQNKYRLTHDSRKINNFFWDGEFEFSNETIVTDYENVVETYFRNISQKRN